MTLDGLATLYMAQGKYAEAEPLALRALHRMEQTCGPEDARLAEYLNGLAILYTLLGKHAEAEPFAQRYERIRNQRIREGSLRPIATGEIPREIWQASLQRLRERPE